MRITKNGWAVVDADTHISKWVEQTGEIDHNMKLLEEWRAYVPEGGVAVDVGASIGDTTIPLATLVGPKGTVLAFEPLSDSYECLLHNLVHAGASRWTLTFNKALGAVPGDLHMAISPNIGASHISAKGITIPVITLDSFNLTRCNFLKIDVEGFELDVLAGAEETIMRTRPIILVEIAEHCTRYGRTKKQVLRWLIDHDYEVSHLFDELEHTFQQDVVAKPFPKD